MQRIIAFLKFGERRYLERMQQGNLYFSNAQTLRAFEMQHAIKGQGDRLEGGTELIANQIKLAKGDASVLLPPMKNGAIPLYFEPADLLPVFCVLPALKRQHGKRRRQYFHSVIARNKRKHKFSFSQSRYSSNHKRT